MKKNKFFILALAIPIIVLLSMTIKPLTANYFGEGIRLETKPMSPRDLFYGDYIVLNFEIERVGLDLLDDALASKFEINEYGDIVYKAKGARLEVYTVLTEDDEGIHRVDYVTEKRPAKGLYVKGDLHVHSGWDGELMVDLPIDRYYIEENTWKPVEWDSKDFKVLTDLKVYKGYPIMKGIITGD